MAVRLPPGAPVPVGSVSIRGPMQRAADIIAADARRLAGWSDRIPGSVHVSVAADGQSATITAGGEAAPQAITFENPGRGMSPPWRRHPVFGRADRPRSEWTWVVQAPRPFMAPAADRSASKAADVLGDGFVAAWARAHRYRQ
jgi:hypothetical protein